MKLRIVYDFTSQPFSLGDILTYHEMSAMLCREGGYDEIDWIFTYDPQEPVQKVAAFAHVTPANFLEHYRALEPLAWVDPKVKSVRLMTHEQFEVFERDCYQWPESIKGGYLFYEIADRLVDHAKQYGDVPQFPNDANRVKWAEHFGGHDFVSVQLRANKRDPDRDSNYAAWREFFASTIEKFVIVGGADEVADELRMDNVTFAKDYKTSALDDLAIIAAAKAHMGPSSGPCNVALFGSKPYRLFNPTNSVALIPGYEKHGTRGRLSYAKPNQWFITELETPGLLRQEYEAMA